MATCLHRHKLSEAQTLTHITTNTQHAARSTSLLKNTRQVICFFVCGQWSVVVLVALARAAAAAAAAAAGVVSWRSTWLEAADIPFRRMAPIFE